MDRRDSRSTASHYRVTGFGSSARRDGHDRPRITLLLLASPSPRKHPRQLGSRPRNIQRLVDSVPASLREKQSHQSGLFALGTDSPASNPPGSTTENPGCRIQPARLCCRLSSSTAGPRGSNSRLTNPLMKSRFTRLQTPRNRIGGLCQIVQPAGSCKS